MAVNGSGFKLTNILIHVTLFTVGIIIVFPIALVILGSFTPESVLLQSPPQIIPEQWSLENYQAMSSENPLGRYLINSLIQTGIITVFQTLTCILAAYAFAILKFPGRDVLFFLILTSLMVPFQITWIPNYLRISDWGWANTYAGLTIPFLASAFGVFLLRQFFRAMPADLYDAARVDGASNWQYLWEIAVPMNRAPIATVVIFAFLEGWNQYMWPLIVTNEVRMRTAQIGVHFLIARRDEGAPWGEVLAATTLLMVPTLLVFMVAQREMVKSIATTGLKG